jgi:hypothetical protein
MKLTLTERYLESFGRYIIKQSRTLLSKKKKNITKELYNSLRFEVKKQRGKLIVNFYMLDYGTFVDKGVSGNKKDQSYRDYKGSVKVTDYKYTTKGPPIDIISKWIKRRGIKPEGTGRGRSKKTGQYISGLAYLISKKIKRDGIKGISFFQRPLELGLKNFGKDLLGNVKEDIIKGIKTQKITVK